MMRRRWRLSQNNDPTDIQLPIMDGYTAVRRIKADAGLRSIPIIAVISYGSMGKKGRRERRDVTIMCRSLSVPANCSRKLGNTSAKSGRDRCQCMIPLRHKADIKVALCPWPTPFCHAPQLPARARFSSIAA
jgi:hypothetical protein